VSERNRMFLLIMIMITICFAVAGFSMWILYETAFEEERERLIETAQIQARLIEAVARFDTIYSKDYPKGAMAATLSQAIDAHKNYKGFGKTGEFTLARRDVDNIVFLLNHRHHDLDNPKPVRFDSELAEPMRLALSGQRGTVVGLDYRGQTVLAAYEPVSELDLGIVAKIDLAEIRLPFVKAILITIGVMILFVLCGTALFLRVSNPIIRTLEEHTDELEKTNKRLVNEIEMRKKAEEAVGEGAEKIKQFAYSVSHDLKNPIIGINLLTQALHRNYKDVLDEKGKNHCNLILKASEQLATLVEQINVYISTKEAPLIIEKVNSNQVFDTVRDEFYDQILVRQISWSQPEKLLEINVDRLSILRVIRNFVDNALKYGGDELSEIEIGYEESDEFHILSIKDDGIGIDEKDSENIFHPFERSVTSTGIDGTGLGLAIANEIANHHMGKVWAEFGLEKGVIFYISISKDLRLTN